VNKDNKILAALILAAALISAYVIFNHLNDDGDPEYTGPYYTIAFHTTNEYVHEKEDGILTDPGVRAVINATYNANSGSFVFYSEIGGPFKIWEVSVEFNNLEPMEEYNIRIGFSSFGGGFYVPSLHDT